MGGFIQKRCSRCDGNVYLDKDQYGWYMKCLQCGHTSDLRLVPEVRVGDGKEGVRPKAASNRNK